MEILNINSFSSTHIVDPVPQHPFSEGERVRHYGRRWSHEAFATILDVMPQYRGDFEYVVAVDHDSNWPSAGTTTQWSSNNTLLPGISGK